MSRELFVVKTPTVPKKLPIDPITDDPFYRYQMRQLQIQHLGNGKMMRTAFLNAEDIAKDLKVPAAYLPHFVAHTLGAKATYDPKKPERERSTVSGHYTPEQLSDMLATFITKFVLCSRCRLPEWSFFPLKSKRVGLKCRGCGQKSYVDELGMDPKFVKFVQNKPPPKSEHLDKNAAKGQEAVKQREKENAKMLKDAEKIKVDDQEDVEFETDISDAAQAARAAEMVPEKLMKLVDYNSGTGDAAAAATAADDDEEDADADAADGADDEGDDGDDGDDDENAAPAANGDASASTSDVDLKALLGGDVKTAAAAVEKVSATDAQRIARLFDSAVPDVGELGAAVKQHGAVFKAVCGVAPATRAVLLLTHWQARVEALSEAERAPLKKRAPVACKALYDADIVEEEHFVAWQKSGNTGALGKLVAPFLNWLAEADEDDDE